MNTSPQSIVALLSILIVWHTRADFVYTVDFNGTNLDSRLYIETPPQYGARLTGAQLELFKDEGAGPGSGTANVYSSFYVTGDFRISIRGFRGRGKASTGLSIQSTTTEHWQAMYMTGPAHLWAAYCHPSGCDSRGYVDDQITNVVFRIRREGLTVTSEFDAGEGFTTLMQTELDGFDLPMRLKLFMMQQDPGAYPPPYTDAASALFDDLRFESQGVQDFVPGTYTTAATISATRLICWPTETGKRYQLQWAPRIADENWLNLHGPIIGDGNSTCLTDLEAPDQARFYRVETLPP
ncbi:MAG TPA: hypothetical protein PLX89_05550 [Verrucomicrobiota bacterium]|nr:hypothetical protein [Verrucomicrobiales bacterium]HRI12452.1 hypothetical protein [Verrucomicrobiota bacterium]